MFRLFRLCIFVKISQMKPLKEKATKKEQELARISAASLQKTAELLRKSTRDYARVKFSEREDYIHVPKKAMKIFLLAIMQMAEGKEVSLVILNEELSTEDAAGILNVSRPFVVKLLEKGAIPHSKVGTHRRLLRSDVEAYRQKMKTIRQDQLEKLTKLDQELGLGYED